MRESIAGTWTMQIVIVFILFFVAFITLTLNYTRAFRVRNEVINIIEREEGYTANHGGDDVGARYLIASYLTNNGYNTKGKCDGYKYGATSLDLNKVGDNYGYQEVKKNDGAIYYYCFKKVRNIPKGDVTTNYENRSYYKVKLFFRFNLPVIGDIATFSVNGETIDIYYNADGITRNEEE